MQHTFTNLVIVLATFAPSITAIHLRIGGTPNKGKDSTTYYPVFNVYSDAGRNTRAPFTSII
jgi:hypothetical protein